MRIEIPIVFLQGILSFFSPCILPIIPLYIGYLSVDDTHNQKRMFINTTFFILGISFAFFILGLGFSTLGQFFINYQTTFTIVGGIIIILVGLMQLFNTLVGKRELRLPIKINVIKMNPITALVMGFTFSFAWTPCVGPTLTSVLIMVSNSETQLEGIILMGIYTLGFILPFIIVGAFTTKCLEMLQKYNTIVKYTVKLGAIIIILIGVMMVTDSFNIPSTFADLEVTDNVIDDNLAPDFELVDQYNKMHKLSEYKGKVVVLNFWATWCPPCVMEMPDIEQLFIDYGLNEQDVVILGVAFPSDENAYTQEGTKQEIIKFLQNNEYTYPTVMDMTGLLGYYYNISAYPTTFIIGADGVVIGYIPGMITYDLMNEIINIALEEN